MFKVIDKLSLDPPVDGIKELRVGRCTEWDEWQVRYIKIDGKVDEDKTYFALDKEDAMDTAQFDRDRMVERGARS